ncbi:MAG: 3-dehydroquinate synthase [Acholeplasmataceae bacterium]|nr:3-dehydroquinate synthase [Acholeplasmataceae bacterium]
MIQIKMPTYDILIQENGLSLLAGQLKSFYALSTLYVITDENVYKLYKETFISALAEYEIHFVVNKAGEKHKSMETYHHTISTLIEKKIRRHHLIVSLGGGVVGDLAGFVAATLYRGMSYIQIPTTLLAQVDSSIGGKVGIDLEEGKNLVGSFCNPRFVLIDPMFLKTLSYKEYANGLAEMIKAGLVGDANLFEIIDQKHLIGCKEIAMAIEVKKALVLIDPFDKKERMFLNFGHTFGHAIEKKHHYATYKHGEAISYGMLIALKVGISHGKTPPFLYDRLKALLIEKGLVQEPLLNMEDYLDAIENDKKQSSDGLHFVIIEDIGKPNILVMKDGDMR